jgi:serine/threonine protein kinase
MVVTTNSELRTRMKIHDTLGDGPLAQPLSSSREHLPRTMPDNGTDKPLERFVELKPDDNDDSEHGSKKVGSAALRGNLTRSQRNRDPLFYYQVESILGIGSMGSVAKVRKRDSVVGGSARKDLRDHFAKEKKFKQCFQIPLIGGLFHFCFKGELEFKHEPAITDSFGSHRSFVSAVNESSVASSSGNNQSNELVYAMKSIHLSRVTDEGFLKELKNEIAILKTLDHPHIVKAIETFEHRNQIFIIMELCSGGDLYSRDPYTEEEAARIASSILSAIAYMHSKGIIHRDLKYENIIFINTSPKAEVKLIDFGLSAAFGNDELTDGVGTM